MSSFHGRPLKDVPDGNTYMSSLRQSTTYIIFSLDELTLQEKHPKIRALSDSGHVVFLSGEGGTDLRLPPTASMPRQILNADAPLVV